MGEPQYIAIEHPWFCSDDMPLYRWTFPDGATNEELTECLDARERWGAQALYDVAWVIDLSSITKAPATQRKMFGEHLKRFEWHNLRWNAGSGLIVPSAWLRGLVTAVFWISPPKFPTKICEDAQQAEHFARRQLARRQRQTQVATSP